MPFLRAVSVPSVLLLVLTLFLLSLDQPAQAQITAQSVGVTGSSAGGSGGGPGTGTVLPSLFTGTMSYSIPIEVPPGRHGMDPELALTYNSNNGNGWLGVGWELEPGAIERRTKFGLTYSGDDYTLRLAGATVDMVNIGSGQYRTQIESGFLRIEKMGSGTSTYWKVTDKTGMKFFFGQTAASRQDNPADASQIFKWCLDRVEDPNGNYMTLSYFKDQGQIYLDRINYTGHTSGTPTTNYVKFYRGSRTDAPPMYTTNFQVVTAYRLKTIEVRANGQPVRAYKLGYTYSGSTSRSLLTSVQQYGKDATVDQTTGAVTGGTALPATTLGWQGGSNGWNYSSGYDSYATGQFIFKGGSDQKGYGTFDSDNWQTLRFADVNGDGRPDACIRMDYGLQCYLSTGSGWAYSTGYDSWTTGQLIFKNNGSAMDTNNWQTIQYPDVNGDGKADACVRLDTGLQCYLSTGSGWAYSTEYDSAATGQRIFQDGTDQHGYGGFDDDNWQTIQYPDVNGDGKADACIRMDYGLQCYLSTGSGWAYSTGYDSAATGQLIFKDNGSAMDTNNWQTIQYPDVNGDGKADACVRLDTGLQCYLSTGSGWAYSTEYDSAATGQRIFQDGTDQHGYGGFDDDNWQTIQYPDVNGDGKADACIRMDYGLQCWQDAPQLELISSISNGLGGNTTISYLPSTQYVNTLLPFPVQTVSSITTCDNYNGSSCVGNSSTTSYTYSGGYYHIGERDFRGFNYVKVTGPVGSNGEQAISETWFHQGNDTAVDVNDPNVSIGYMKGKPYRVKVTNGAGNVYTKTTTSYVADTASPYFNPPAQVDTYICDGDGVCGRHLQAVYPATGYDVYGNVTTEYQYGDLADPNDDRTITRTFSPDVTDWIVGLPATESIAYLENGASKTLTTQFFYDGGSDCTVGSGSSTPTKGNLTRVTRGGIAETHMGYDLYGNLTCTQDANGNLTMITYDGSNTFPTLVTNPLNQTTTTQYYSGVPTDAGLYGQVKSVTDPNGAITTMQYDPLGRKISADAPDGGQTTWSYVGFGAVGSQYIYTTTLVSQTPSATYLYSWNYFDGLGRTFRDIKSGPGTSTVRTDTTYDARGQVATVSLPYIVGSASGQPTTYLHDPMGRVVKVINSDGSTTLSCYNDGVAAAVDANGHKKRQVTDAAGRVVQVNEYTGVFTTCDTAVGTPYATTIYVYNGMGNLTSVTDTKGNVSTMTYDILGRKLTMHDPDMGNWSYQYDANGNLIQQTDAKNQVTYFQYDALNRRVQKDYGTKKALGSGDVVYTYDQTTSYGKGRLTSVRDGSGSTTFYYDSMGRVKRTDKTITGGSTYITQTAYDLAGRVATITYPDTVGSVVSYIYSGTVLSQVKDGTTTIATYSGHNALSQPGRVDYGNGVYTVYSYVSTNFRLNTLMTSAPGGGVYQNLTYGYDYAGNIKTITDPLNGNQSINYDDLNRLTSATGPYGAMTYAYDSIGNMICNKEVSTCSDTAPNYTYPTSGASSIRPHAVSTAGVNSYGYDANGNMITKPGQTLTYDYENRLTNVTNGNIVTTLMYDGDGGRVKKTVGQTVTIYIGKLYECTGTTCTRHIFAGDQRIAQIQGGQLSYVHTDHLGSTSVVTSSTGTLAQKYIYYPYGKLYQSTIYSGTATPYKFTGQLLDDSTGLYFYNARYYDAAIGRFIQADTVVPAAFNPQSLNRYSYVLNNPLIYIDPTGHFSLKKLWKHVSEVVKGTVAVTLVVAAWAIDVACAGCITPIAVGMTVGMIAGGTYCGVSGNCGIGTGMLVGAVGGGLIGAGCMLAECTLSQVAVDSLGGSASLCFGGYCEGVPLNNPGQQPGGNGGPDGGVGSGGGSGNAGEPGNLTVPATLTGGGGQSSIPLLPNYENQGLAGALGKAPGQMLDYAQLGLALNLTRDNIERFLELVKPIEGIIPYGESRPGLIVFDRTTRQVKDVVLADPPRYIPQTSYTVPITIWGTVGMPFIRRYPW